ncbi:hypothetical protein QCE62_32740 [Caballeronia sp. LZ033]|uniref:hypothetical protein n=1 Tax=Caballeronia sp. LZ033 TaxID=3038566 RepID=UPI002860B9D6|nr:hypothetical protein [Caballeronia sp. LZ033]MDR5818391.1 hypothetical protein [Caballeronia sp. LZ033]
MPTLNVDGLTFTFPQTWQVSKYDEWSFYRLSFARQGEGIKAIDVLAITETNVAFFIEVKDYRHPDTEKPSHLPEAIASKVLHTLAAMLPAKLRANVDSERQLASAILACDSLSVIAHLEQPQNHRPVVDPADIQQKLRRLLRAVDAHPKVVSKSNLRGLNWTVT